MYHCDNIFFDFNYPNSSDSNEVESNESSILVCKKCVNDPFFKNIIMLNSEKKTKIDPNWNIFLIDATNMVFADMHNYILNRPNILIFVYKGNKHILDRIRAKFDFGKYEEYNYIIVYKDKAFADSLALIMIVLYIRYLANRKNSD